MIDRDNQEIKLYINHSYCVRTPLTWQSYKMYCEFNNIAVVEMEIEITKPMWESVINNDELKSLL